jgi:D-3-phosphoglycerate dehydrogenase/C-terminal binding protein
VAPLVRRQKGLTFGVVGLGRIGLAAARRAAAFDMKVIFYDPYLPNGVDLATGYERVRTLAELARRSDIVSIHAPLSDETRNMIGRDFFAAAKDGMLLVNTARGPIVDERALVEALQAGTIAGAALDVFEREPEVEEGLLALENVVLTPHLGSATRDTRVAMGLLCVEALRAVLLEGRRPANAVG